MLDKIFLSILILCGIWSQGITGTFADEEIKNTTDFLVRQKRVVSHVPGEDIPLLINEAPYTVFIRSAQQYNCLGNILSYHVVITAAPCVTSDPKRHKIISSSSRSNRGFSHEVIDIRKHYGNQRGDSRDGVGLLTINPPFEYSRKCQPINLHSAPLLPGVIGKVAGFGFISYNTEVRGTKHPENLRSIEVPIISHQDCVRRYRPHFEISDREVCTFDPRKHCGHSDGGAGLVVNRELAGVFLQSGILSGHIDPRYPDIFVILQDTHYIQWIRANVENIEAHFHNILLRHQDAHRTG